MTSHCLLVCSFLGSAIQSCVISGKSLHLSEPQFFLLSLSAALEKDFSSSEPIFVFIIYVGFVSLVIHSWYQWCAALCGDSLSLSCWTLTPAPSACPSLKWHSAWPDWGKKHLVYIFMDTLLSSEPHRPNKPWLKGSCAHDLLGMGSWGNQQGNRRIRAGKGINYTRVHFQAESQPDSSGEIWSVKYTSEFVLTWGRELGFYSLTLASSGLRALWGVSF